MMAFIKNDYPHTAPPVASSGMLVESKLLHFRGRPTQYQIFGKHYKSVTIPQNSHCYLGCIGGVRKTTRKKERFYKQHDVQKIQHRDRFGVGYQYHRLKFSPAFDERTSDQDWHDTCKELMAFDNPDFLFSMTTRMWLSLGHYETIRLTWKGLLCSFAELSHIAILSPMRSLGRTLANCWPVGWYR